MSYVNLLNILIYKCRICLEDDGTIDIFSTPELQTNISTCTGIMVLEDDDYPKCICGSCNELILTSMRLRSLATETNERLKRIQSSEEAVELDLFNDCTPNIEVSDDIYCPFLNVIPRNETVPASNNRSKNTRNLKKRKKNTPLEVNVETNSFKGKKQHIGNVMKIFPKIELDDSHNDRSFTFNGSYNKHEKSLACKICGKVSKNRSSLYHHHRTHDEVKKYPCTACTKSFSTRSDLVKHIRVHTGEKPFKCDTCGKNFTQNGTLKAHRLNVHFQAFLKDSLTVEIIPQ